MKLSGLHKNYKKLNNLTKQNYCGIISLKDENDYRKEVFIMKKNIESNLAPYHYYNANPKGRRTDDCVVRAISTATGQTWDETLMGLTQCAIKHKYMVHCPELYGKYLNELGFEKQKQPRKKDNKRIRACEFVKTFKGTAVANIGAGHVACLKDGQVWDIWDSSGEVVGNYWVKK